MFNFDKPRLNKQKSHCSPLIKSLNPILKRSLSSTKQLENMLLMNSLNKSEIRLSSNSLSREKKNLGSSHGLEKIGFLKKNFVQFYEKLEKNEDSNSDKEDPIFEIEETNSNQNLARNLELNEIENSPDEFDADCISPQVEGYPQIPGIDSVENNHSKNNLLEKKPSNDLDILLEELRNLNLGISINFLLNEEDHTLKEIARFQKYVLFFSSLFS